MPTLRLVATTFALVLLGAAQAFTWEPFVFPEGDQSYTLEVVEADDIPSSTIRIEIVDVGDGYDVTTTTTLQQTGVSQDDLQGAAFGGGAFGMFAMGPMMMFGPSFMMLPMMLGEEEIRVREEPIRVMGAGSLYMEEEVEVAGQRCVVLRFEPDQEGGGGFEFAVAEGVPFPCYSRYGTGDDVVEIRLLEITR
jgi:hypothetical protein